MRLVATTRYRPFMVDDRSSNSAFNESNICARGKRGLAVSTVPAECDAAVVPAYPRSTTSVLEAVVASQTYINSDSHSITDPERKPPKS